jgi:PAS domain S-box-containing protein
MARTRRPRIELTDTLQNVNVPSVVVDREGSVTWLNEAAERSFGDLRGRPFTSVVAPEDMPVVRRQLQRKLRGAQATDYAVDVFTADGARRRVEISSVPIKGGDGCHAVFGVALPGPPERPSPAVRLTARQTDVLKMLGEGASTDEIATSLHLSKETVRNHIRHVFRALGVHSRLEAVAQAHRLGLLRDW